MYGRVNSFSLFACVAIAIKSQLADCLQSLIVPSFTLVSVDSISVWKEHKLKTTTNRNTNANLMTNYNEQFYKKTSKRPLVGNNFVNFVLCKLINGISQTKLNQKVFYNFVVKLKHTFKNIKIKFKSKLSIYLWLFWKHDHVKKVKK